MGHLEFLPLCICILGVGVTRVLQYPIALPKASPADTASSLTDTIRCSDFLCPLVHVDRFSPLDE